MFKIKCKHVSTEKQKTQTKISFSTKDIINPLDLINIENAPGYLVFCPDKITQEAELAMRDTRIGVNTKGQSGSKKLRAALYEYWFDKEDTLEFDDFYNQKIDSLIKIVVNKI